MALAAATSPNTTTSSTTAAPAATDRPAAKPLNEVGCGAPTELIRDSDGVADTRR